MPQPHYPHFHSFQSQSAQHNHTTINNHANYSLNTQTPGNQIYSNTINQNTYTNYVSHSSQVTAKDV